MYPVQAETEATLFDQNTKKPGGLGQPTGSIL